MGNLKIKVIVNPASGGGATRGRWRRFLLPLESRYGPLNQEFTSCPGEAVHLTRKALDEGFNYIIGLGGDGTFNEIVNGYMEKDKPVNPDASLSLLPSGRGNDFLRSVRGETGATKTLDLVKVSASGRERYFCNVSSFGMGGEVARRVAKRGNLLKTAYLAKALSAILSSPARRVRALVDGREEIRGDYWVGALCNGGYFGGKMKVSSKASLEDGWLDLCMVRKVARRDLLPLLINSLTGKAPEGSETVRRRCRSLTLVPLEGGEFPWEYDGELGKGRELFYTVVPGVVKFRIERWT